MNNDLKAAMKEVFKALENDLTKFETKQGNLKMSYQVTADGISTSVVWSNVPKEAPKVAETTLGQSRHSKALENEIACKRKRKEFEDYVARLDDEIYQKAIDSFTNEDEVNKLNDAIFNNITNPELMDKAIKTMTDKFHATLMDTISTLKTMF